jgi:hypothetical protein
MSRPGPPCFGRVFGNGPRGFIVGWPQQRAARDLIIVNTGSRERSRCTSVVEVLKRVGRDVGFPSAISIKGPSSSLVTLTSGRLINAALLSTSRDQTNQPTTHLSKFRAEGLNAHWFMGLDHAGENARLSVEITTKKGLIARLATAHDGADKSISGSWPTLSKHPWNPPAASSRRGAVHEERTGPKSGAYAEQVASSD